MCLCNSRILCTLSSDRPVVRDVHVVCEPTSCFLVPASKARHVTTSSTQLHVTCWFSCSALGHIKLALSSWWPSYRSSLQRQTTPPSVLSSLLFWRHTTRAFGEGMRSIPVFKRSLKTFLLQTAYTVASSGIDY